MMEELVKELPLMLAKTVKHLEVAKDAKNVFLRIINRPECEMNELSTIILKKVFLTIYIGEEVEDANRFILFSNS